MCSGRVWHMQHILPSQAKRLLGNAVLNITSSGRPTPAIKACLSEIMSSDRHLVCVTPFGILHRTSFAHSGMNDADSTVSLCSFAAVFTMRPSDKPFYAYHEYIGRLYNNTPLDPRKKQIRVLRYMEQPEAYELRVKLSTILMNGIRVEICRVSQRNLVIC